MRFGSSLGVTSNSMNTTRPSLLVRIRQKSDAGAWAEFDAIYRPMLLRFARSCGLASADADEVTQECMALISEHIKAFDYDPGRGRFKGWLKTCVINQVRKLRRKRKEAAAESGQFNVAQDREPDPDVLFDTLWMREHLRFCLEQIRHDIDENVYRAFELLVLKEWPADRVCDACKIEPNNLYQIKWRMLRRIQARMTEIVGPSE